ncbi:hypothetical protein MnTg01_00944 [archaeon MnTg01]|nr:hypothetical protein MnTg01_00944 [archaeon MnTg01]
MSILILAIFSNEISSKASIITTFFSIESKLIVCPILNSTSAPRTFAPFEFKSHEPHVVSAKTYAGIPNLFIIFEAVS